jgi:hypothetical protein
MWRAGAALIAGCLLLPALLLAGCGGKAPPVATATATAASPTLAPLPRPTSTPLPPVIPPRPSGRVLSRLAVQCLPAETGLEVRVRYGASIDGATNDVAAITRVRILVNGYLFEDSGVISSQVFARATTFGGRSNQGYRVVLDVDTWAAPHPSDFIEIVRCPALPDTLLA